MRMRMPYLFRGERFDVGPKLARALVPVGLLAALVSGTGASAQAAMAPRTANVAAPEVCQMVSAAYFQSVAHKKDIATATADSQVGESVCSYRLRRLSVPFAEIDLYYTAADAKSEYEMECVGEPGVTKLPALGPTAYSLLSFGEVCLMHGSDFIFVSAPESETGGSNLTLQQLESLARKVVAKL
jgi:hypothetical protein